MTGLALVLPMAGAGSRFQRGGMTVPKPLIELAGRPFFTWAADSVLRAAPVRQIVAVVLQAHVRDHGVDAAVRRAYPNARIVVLDALTAGAAETAAHGVAEVVGDGPLAINDCDHAFLAGDMSATLQGLETGLDAALVGFHSQSPAYAYAELDGQGLVRRVVEKQPISPYAVAGCYLFRSRERFLRAFDGYREACPYDELFVSGLYSRMLAEGGRIGFQALAEHVSFGTPEELARVTPARLARLTGKAAA